MKVRWTSESLRLRITPTELDCLLKGESIHQALEFAGKTAWKIVLERASAETRLIVDLGSVTLGLSETDRQNLAARDREGVYFTTQDAFGSSLRYYVEKDFPCIHPGETDAIESPTETFLRS